MRVAYSNFRCFRKTDFVPIRPITLLVGENSAGKTSFLAATRYLLEIFNLDSTKPSFNKDPFYLGSYEQIAHYRGGKAGRAKEFAFSIEGQLVQKFLRRDSFDPDVAFQDDSFSLRVTFCQKQAQPFITSMSFRCGQFGLELIFSDDRWSIKLLPSKHTIQLNDERFAFGSDFSFVLPRLYYLLSDFYFTSRSKKGSQTDLLVKDSSSQATFEAGKKDSRAIAALFRAAIKSIAAEVYATAPVRSKPERTYNPTDFTQLPDGGHTPYVLAELQASDKSRSDDIHRELAYFGKRSGLFEKIEVKQLGGKVGSPFQINVTLPDKKSKVSSNIVDVGYGVNQALPILTDLLRMAETTFLLQQPEVHLHPRAQAELGSFIVRTAEKRGHRFLIETHSDYLIDRIRTEVRTGTYVKPADVVILYFSRRGHDVSVQPITFDSDGNALGAPDDYRQFFLEEEMRSLGLEL